ncbi:MAG TPA: HAMP domain-containing histidine kinase, partial [Planctomycetes bacterium]|nr:HAMP domain-containing histidine kinase [Planctomycetota bacterium]
GNNCPVTVEIADTGTGFDEEVARRLFAPFFSTKKAGHGTGLGLSISMSIIKDHQGAIEARGMPGEGAVFIVRLPVERKEGAAEENGG